MAEMKRKEILFCFPSFKKDDERARERGRRVSGGAGRDARGEQLLKGVNNPHNNTHNSQVRECYDYVPSTIQYNSSRDELVTTTTTRPTQQQTVSSSYCQESRTPFESSSGSPCCSHDCAPPAAPPPSITKAMSKTVRMTLVIVLVYTICWSPYFIVQLWAAWDPNPPVQGQSQTVLLQVSSLISELQSTIATLPTHVVHPCVLQPL